MAGPILPSKVYLLSDVYKDPDRKSILRMIREILSLTIYRMAFPRHYFARYLFKKNRNNIKDYFPDKFLYNIKAHFNDRAVADVVENKLYYNFFYNQFNISLPKILMFNHRTIFAVGSNIFEINNPQDFRTRLEDLFKQNPSYDSIFAKRTYGTYGGEMVYKIRHHLFDTNSEMINELYFTVVKTGFIFQETVKQHPVLDKLCPSSLNTMRLDTFIDKDGRIEIISGFIRMSINNSHVDNISSGGCYVGIDIENGKMKKEGYTSFSKYGVKILSAHPITNTIFENFTIPLFNQAKELVLRAASLMPGLRLMGWDVAIGESFPVLIEGNSDYDIIGNDLSFGGYRRNAIFRKVLGEIDKL